MSVFSNELSFFLLPFFKTPFTLSSADLNLSNGPDSQQTLPIRWTPDDITRSRNEQQRDTRSPSKFSPAATATAACDDHGQIFVDDTVPDDHSSKMHENSSLISF